MPRPVLSLIADPKGKLWIKNFARLVTSAERRFALSLVNAGLNAIDTAQVMASSMALEGEVLRIKNQRIDLGRFRKIHVLGAGKAAREAAMALEGILGTRVAGGIVIGTGDECGDSRFAFHRGTHPLPSPANVEASRRMVAYSQSLTKDDLALVIVSGGGSAHLCWPPSECEQGQRLYQDFSRAGGTIVELNTVRKHLSALKGGGLAQMLHPAAVVGLIFSDVPGDNYNLVASGPTYWDETTVEDAGRILEKYDLSGYDLIETPKDAKSFAAVSNIPLVSNQIALQAMRGCAEAQELKTTLLSDCLYDPVAVVAEKMFAAARGRSRPSVVLAGGEPEVKVPALHGRGGRNQLLALHALSHIKGRQVFISFGSDGQDNGPCAGAIADAQTASKARKLLLDRADYLKRFNAQTFFEMTGDLIMTGPTGANVSDLMLLLTI